MKLVEGEASRSSILNEDVLVIPFLDIRIKNSLAAWRQSYLFQMNIAEELLISTCGSGSDCSIGVGL